jgi:hypothetical protein
MKLATAYRLGCAKALEKLALGPPTQVDQFVADVESGKDVPPEPPPMAQGSMMPPTALDGTMPLSTSPPTPQDTIGSTVGTPPLPGNPAAQPPPTMGALHG